MINTSKSPGSLLSRVAPLALLLLASANLYAQQPVSIFLKGDFEVPPVTTAAMGTGQITVLPDHTVSGSIKTSGLVPTMAHIHEAAAGKNGPPIITLTKTANDSFVVPPDAKLTDAQYTSYMAGNLYVNVHSAQYPNGEIRAQLPSKPMRIAN
ncbi:MAG: CHRD domain-containing protein [Sulfuricella sp.]